MNILLDPKWGNWTQTTDGSGVVSINNGILTATSDDGERAYLTSEHSCVAGETYIFSCIGRVVANNPLENNPGMFIDHPSLPSGRNRVFFDSDEFKYYELKFTVPLNNDQSRDTVTFGAGSWTATEGTIEVINPQVRCEKVTPMSSNIWARGLINIDTSGNATITNQIGIKSVEWRPNDGGNPTDESNLFVTLEHGSPTDLNTPMYPRAFISTSGPESYIVKGPANITGGVGGQFNLKVLDTITGSYITQNPTGNINIQIEVVY